MTVGQPDGNIATESIVCRTSEARDRILYGRYRDATNKTLAGFGL